MKDLYSVNNMNFWRYCFGFFWLLAFVSSCNQVFRFLLSLLPIVMCISYIAYHIFSSIYRSLIRVKICIDDFKKISIYIYISFYHSCDDLLPTTVMYCVLTSILVSQYPPQKYQKYDRIEFEMLLRCWWCYCQSLPSIHPLRVRACCSIF